MGCFSCCLMHHSKHHSKLMTTMLARGRSMMMPMFMSLLKVATLLSSFHHFLNQDTWDLCGQTCESHRFSFGT